MEWPLVNNVSIIKVKQKKLLLKSGWQASNVDERIPKDLLIKILQTSDSDVFGHEGGSTMQSLNTFRDSRIELDVEEHPIYDNMTSKQAKAYDEFVMLANDEFLEFDWQVKSVAKMWLNEINLLRFLKARSFKIKPALKMWKNWVEWRMNYQFPKKEDVQDLEIKKHFKMYRQDKSNNPVIIINPGSYEGDVDPDTILSVWVYIIEKATKKSDKQSYGAVSVIFDRKGMTQSKDQKWFPVYKKMAQTLQDYYPERLNKAYIVNANWFTRVIVGMWKVFLSKDTRTKIWTVAKLKDLERYIEPRNIISQYSV